MTKPTNQTGSLKKNQQAVHRFHTHSIPLDMEDIEADWDKPVANASIATKASIIIRVGMLALSAGCGSFRVRDLMHSMAYPLHVHVRADVNLTDIEATCTDGSNRITEVINLPNTGVNTERIWLLEHFVDWFNLRLGIGTVYHSRGRASNSLIEHLEERDASQFFRRLSKHEKELVDDPATRKALAKPITVSQIHHRLDLIEHRKPLYSTAMTALASAVACGCFVFLLGGGPFDMLGAFIGAGLGQAVRRTLMAKHINQFVVVFIAVAVAALSCTGFLHIIGNLFYPPALLHDTAYIGAMLFVIPGFPIITSGMDMAKVDMQSGIQRLAYALTVILIATFAGWMVASVIHLDPQGFAPLNMNPWLLMLCRMVCAFGGVWGFSVLFNSPQRMCVVAGCIGLVTDTLRLELVDVGMSMELAAFIGALLAGLLASFWRFLVRHCYLPVHWGYPRISLTIPSIVIMVPGLYMYQAMYHLGQFDTLSAMNWAFKAFMVIICLPVGLIMARVLTDRAWRYDE